MNANRRGNGEDCGRNRRFLCAGLLLGLWPLTGQSEPILYGSAQAALQLLRQSGASETGVSANGSHVGVKGVEDIGGNARALWRLETGIDLSGENSTTSLRDSYLGLEGGYGQLLIGVAETPFSRLRARLTLFADTCADSRSLLGAASAAGNVLDVRARNMLQYQSPRLLQFFTGSVMYAGGDHDTATAGTTGGDDHRYELTSASLQMRLGPLFGAASWQEQSLPGRDDRRGARAGASLRFDRGSVGILYERLWGGDDRALNRDVYALHFTRDIADATAGVQWLAATNQSGVSDSGAWQLSAGYGRRLSPALSAQLLWSRLVNQRNAGYGNDFVDGDNGGAGGSGTVSVLSAGMKLDF